MLSHLLVLPIWPKHGKPNTPFASDSIESSTRGMGRGWKTTSTARHRALTIDQRLSAILIQVVDLEGSDLTVIILGRCVKVNLRYGRVYLIDSVDCMVGPMHTNVLIIVKICGFINLWGHSYKVRTFSYEVWRKPPKWNNNCRVYLNIKGIGSHKGCLLYQLVLSPSTHSLI